MEQRFISVYVNHKDDFIVYDTAHDKLIDIPNSIKYMVNENIFKASEKERVYNEILMSNPDWLFEDINVSKEEREIV